MSKDFLLRSPGDFVQYLFDKHHTQFLLICRDAANRYSSPFNSNDYLQEFYTAILDDQKSQKLQLGYHEKGFGYLVTAIRRRISNLNRAYQRRLARNMGYSSAQEEDDIIDDANEELLHEAYRFINTRLHVRQQQILKLHLNNVKSVVIAETLGMNPSTVRTQLERIKKNLRSHLIDEGFDIPEV